MPTTIEDRIAKLETSNRRLRLMLLGVVVAGAVGLGLGMTQASKVPDVIQAKKFEVVNGAEEVCVRLASDEDGGGGWLQITDGVNERVILGGSQGFLSIAGPPDNYGAVQAFEVLVPESTDPTIRLTRSGRTLWSSELWPGCYPTGDDGLMDLPQMLALMRRHKNGELGRARAANDMAALSRLEWEVAAIGWAIQDLRKRAEQD